MKIKMGEFSGKCSCGRNHELSVKKILLEKGALQKIPDILKQKPYHSYHHFALICDENTYEAAGRKVEKLLTGIPVVKLDSKNLHADEIGTANLREQLKSIGQTDCLLAVGSGTIHDLTRYCAYEAEIPFISIPTAASVDGYVSTIAAMSWYGFKKSMIAESPILVIADSQVLADAPMRLTASGVGDLLGKYTALADWEITHALNGEPICENICRMEYEALKQLKTSLPGLVTGKIEAYERLMYGLLLSGLAMQMAGNSRPASGAEHHMAHFWEMAVINEKIDAYHGEKVGVALMQVSDIYHKAAEKMEENQFQIQDYVEIESELIERTFRNPDLCRQIKKINETDLLASIQSEELIKKNQEIIRVIKKIPKPDEIRKMLTQAGGVYSLKDIGLSMDIREKTARAAPYIRDRITFLRILKYYDFYSDVIR